MKKISVVLAGICGYGGLYLKEMLYGELGKTIDIKGLVDPHPDNCLYLEEIKKLGIKIHSSLEDFYADNNAELAILSTPIVYHANQIIYCMENGSNVLCEKPLCSDVKDVERIRNVKEKTGKFLLIGYQWSTSKAILGLKKDITDGIYGSLKSMKTLVLWPRDVGYYKRAWGGKKYSDNGEAIFDSVANNAAAHFLHNMFYVIDKCNLLADMPTDISAELGRANEIENFDTILLNFKLNNDAQGYFIASHATEKQINPVFCFEFEKGYIVNVSCDTEENNVPYGEFGEIIGIMKDGGVKNYGHPDFNGHISKFEVAVDLAYGKEKEYCGLENAAIHTKVINHIQNNFEILDFQKTRIKNDYVIVDGLDDLMLEIYKNPQRGKLEDFLKGNIN